MKYNDGTLASLIHFIVDIQEAIREGTNNKYSLSCVLTDKKGKKVARFGKYEKDCPVSMLSRKVRKSLITNGGIIINMPNNELALSELDSAYWSDDAVNVCDDMVVVTGRNYLGDIEHPLKFLKRWHEDGKGKISESKYTDNELSGFMKSNQNLLVTYQLFGEIRCILAKIDSFNEYRIFLSTMEKTKEPYYRSDILQIR